MQDYGRATIIGSKTYGKASVQNIMHLPDGSGLKLTIAKYFTPKGRSIHGIGIEPDIKVEIDHGKEEAKKTEELDENLTANSAKAEYDLEKDVQLKKAVETIQEQVKNVAKK